MTMMIILTHQSIQNSLMQTPTTNQQIQINQMGETKNWPECGLNRKFPSELIPMAKSKSDDEKKKWRIDHMFCL